MAGPPSFAPTSGHATLPVMIPRASCLVAFVGLALGCPQVSAPAGGEPHRVGYGTVMADVGRRFEQLGRAAIAGRHELAEYHLGEIDEQFEEALPQADPPHEGHPEVLPGMTASFLETVGPLRAALAGRDRSAIVAAFARTATACNECHRASGHGFIEIPGEPGSPVPSLDPVP